MNFTVIILSIIVLICIAGLVILYIKMNKIQSDLDTHIINDLKELPTDITLDKLKVNTLEVVDNLKTSNINSLDDSISINNDLDIKSNSIKINPNLTLNTTYNYNDNKDKFNNKQLDIIQFDNSDETNIPMNLHLDEGLYYLYSNLKNRSKKSSDRQNIKSENEFKIITITDDDKYIYYNDKIIGVKDEQYLQEDPNIEYVIFDTNSIIEISSDLYKHFKDVLNNNNSDINNKIYPEQILKKIKEKKYKINLKVIQENTSDNQIENFIDIPSYNYYVYDDEDD